MRVEIKLSDAEGEEIIKKHVQNKFPGMTIKQCYKKSYDGYSVELVDAEEKAEETV